MSELTAGSLAEMLSDVVDDTETLANTSAAVHGEAHFRAGVFTKLRQDILDVFPIAEPSYGDGSERFHICLLKSKIPVGWIEIRKAWLGAGEGWKANTAEQLRNLLWDVAKVAYQARNEPDGYGYVAAFFHNQRDMPFAPDVLESSGEWFARSYLTETEAGSAQHGNECVERLCAWCEAKGDGAARHKVWDAFGLSERMLAAELRAQYVRCLRLVADVEVRTPRNMPVELEYQVIAARLHKEKTSGSWVACAGQHDRQLDGQPRPRSR